MRPLVRLAATGFALALPITLGAAGCLLVTHEDASVYGEGPIDGSQVSPPGAEPSMDSTRSDAQAGVGADADAPDADADSAVPCRGSAGPAGVRVSAGFCIDSTEVTVAQYALFLATDAGPASAGCADSGTFTPMNWQYEAADAHPVAAVSWCAAQSYCAWAGKRLCGKVGGGSIVLTDNQDPVSEASNEWAFACSHAGQSAYPYGGDYQAQACNGKQRTTQESGLVPVASLPLCEGGFPGIFDMSGNLSEWTDACDSMGTCHALGGSYTSLAAGDLACTSFVSQPRTAQGDYDIGFRCCAD